MAASFRWAMMRAMSAERIEPISDVLLRQAAGPGAYARGAAYHAQGRVEVLAIEAGRTLARVRGSMIYRVDLGSQGGRPAGVCDCPAFDDAGFCKHLVAVALTVNSAAREGRAPVDRISAARRFLAAEGVEALVERLLRRALRDPALLDEIELDAADARDDDDTLAARYRGAIDEACNADGGVDWRGAGDFAEAIDQVLARLERLLADGRSTGILGLLEHLFDQMEDAFEAVDDSDGEIGGVLARAGAIHLQACRQARPDPRALAGALFAREVEGSWNTFEDAAGTYADVLGPEGLAEYRRLATGAWNAGGSERSWTLKSILDGVAQREGDLEARIALRKDDLRQPGGYLEIAGLLVDAGREGEALKWLEEALWCFEDRPDKRLHSFTAELLAATGRPAEAEALLWTAFEHWPGLDLYRKLQAVAPDPGGRFERALAILRAQMTTAGPSASWQSPAGEILTIQLAEGLIDDAWKTVEAHDVGETNLKALADASAASHPAQAAAAYERLVEARLRAGGAGNYDVAIALIKHCAAVRRNPQSQARYIADLAVRHKAKRTFIARLQTLS